METNERLRTAMTQVGVTIDDLAVEAGVDPKSVQRWIGGRIPHRRNRWTTAKLLGTDPEWLWPETDEGLREGARTDGEIVASFARRSLATPDLWEHLIRTVQGRLDLLGYAIHHVPEQHPSIFQAAERVVAEAGRVRVMLADPDGACAVQRDAEEELEGALLARIRTSAKYLCDGLPDEPGVELRWHDTPMYCSYFRFDDDVLVTPHLFHRPGWHSPLLHLRRLRPSGIFENYAQHFDDIWDAARPMER